MDKRRQRAELENGFRCVSSACDSGTRLVPERIRVSGHDELLERTRLGGASYGTGGVWGGGDAGESVGRVMLGWRCP